MPMRYEFQKPAQIRGRMISVVAAQTAEYNPAVSIHIWKGDGYGGS